MLKSPGCLDWRKVYDRLLNPVLLLADHFKPLFLEIGGAKVSQLLCMNEVMEINVILDHTTTQYTKVLEPLQ
jgi:hypothetical protein